MRCLRNDKRRCIVSVINTSVCGKTLLTKYLRKGATSNSNLQAESLVNITSSLSTGRVSSQETNPISSIIISDQPLSRILKKPCLICLAHFKSSALELHNYLIEATMESLEEAKALFDFHQLFVNTSRDW